MNNYGTGSMLKTVRELISTSRLTDDARRNALVGFAVDEAETTLNQEREASRNPHPQSWESVRLARAILSGEVNRVGAAAVAIHAAQWSLKVAAIADLEPGNRPVYPAASAAYDVGMAALCETDWAIRDAVRALLCVSHYAYTVNIKENGYTVAIAAERATMDRHEASLRTLLMSD